MTRPGIEKVCKNPSIFGLEENELFIDDFKSVFIHWQ